ncbi:hypothetical protein QYF36_002038 [Acer negundo]|nr:hypothetical protein QYF36_002038 [Acer negundo]
MGHDGTTAGVFGYNQLEQGSEMHCSNTKSANCPKFSYIPSFSTTGSISFVSNSPETQCPPSNFVYSPLVFQFAGFGSLKAFSHQLVDSFSHSFLIAGFVPRTLLDIIFLLVATVSR